jgi:hypothetical protein
MSQQKGKVMLTAIKATALAALIGLATIGGARADCESDLTQLEQAYKTANLTAEAKGYLDGAKAKAVAALKKDDDQACHKAIAEAAAKAKVPFK